MVQKIKDYLKELEQEKSIKILLACETGSRAWGFPSPDSDFDIRLVYVHKTDWYLRLNEPKDSIELMLDNNEIDISGWDLRKSMKLLWKSNPALLERIQSPIIYMQEEKFVSEINEIANACYSRIATLHHYLSLSKKFFFELQKDERYKLKSFFYCLRSSVACLWILKREEKPPIQFEHMLSGLKLNSSIVSRIRDLIELKSHKSESYKHDGEAPLFQFIEENIRKATEGASSLPGSKAKIDVLNDFFIKQLRS